MAENTTGHVKNIGLLLASYLVMLAVTFAASVAVDAPFTLLFIDAPLCLLLVYLWFIVFGLGWDGALALAQYGRNLTGEDGKEAPTLWQRYGFFSLGYWPMFYVLFTTAAVLSTSNITLISLKLLKTHMHWRDAFFWELEGGLLSRLKDFDFPVLLIDSIYHGVWVYLLFGVFLTMVISRDFRLVVSFCLSLIVVFYLSRFIGLLSPVMGPAFHKPEFFLYLEGTWTRDIMNLITRLMAEDPEVITRSGVLIGGVAAMPSLHIAMYAVIIYWMAAATRKSLLITIPWTLLAWACTIIMGWHYLMDGLGGIATAALSVWIARAVLKPFGIIAPSSRRPQAEKRL